MMARESPPTRLDTDTMSSHGTAWGAATAPGRTPAPEGPLAATVGAVPGHQRAAHLAGVDQVGGESWDRVPGGSAVTRVGAALPRHHRVSRGESPVGAIPLQRRRGAAQAGDGHGGGASMVQCTTAPAYCTSLPLLHHCPPLLHHYLPLMHHCSPLLETPGHHCTTGGPCSRPMSCCVTSTPGDGRIPV